MTRILVTLSAAALAAMLGALLFAWSGLYSVAASRGHWAVTEWLLQFALRNSVETHALPITAPPLDDPAMLHRGLGHYEAGCKPCHGAPGDEGNPIVRSQLPQPPYLPDSVADWSDAELFWIVKNGFKYTGMPAWVAQDRDDEVWSVVAFIRRMPEMAPEEYRRLARADTLFDPDRIGQTAELMAAAGPVGGSLLACARCHGLRGEGGGAGAFPTLAGQKEDYLRETLRAYAAGTRPSGIMQPIAAELTAAEIQSLARHYAAMPPLPTSDSTPASVEAALRLGETIATAGLPDQGVPACDSCHGGRGTERDNPLYPDLRGQHAAYLTQQLTLWTEGKRGGSPLARIMAAAVRTLPADHIAAVAGYYASTRPVRDAGR